MKRTLAIVLSAVLFALGLAACITPPVSQTPPIRAAFYYPTFPEWWNQQGFNPFTNYTPTRGFYDTNAVVASQIADMQYGGLTAGIASWWGKGTKSDSRIPNLLTAASGTGFQWGLYYEPEGIGDPSAAAIKADLDYIMANYANDASFLHVNNKPVVFAFAQGTDGCAMVDRWASANSNHNFYVDLKVFPGYKTCAHQPDSWHQYGPSSATDSQPGYSYSVSPGFWKKGEATPRLARNTATFTSNVQAMVASKAPWQLITTYNEWGEGTPVESASAWSSPSGHGAYMDILHQVLTGTTTTTTAPKTTTTIPKATTTTIPSSAGVCGNAGTPKANQKVVVFSFENRNWSGVGGTQFQSLPYLNGLAKQCPTFANYTEPDTSQNSATQYVGQTSGTIANSVQNDCSPSATCDSTADNIFRQVRAAGKVPRSYVEGATANCSASGNAAKHIPALYFLGGTDHSFCNTEVVPYSQFNPNSLADFSFVTPTLCNDGHDCSNSTVNAWAQSNIQPVLNSAAYKAGNVTVFIWYDEDKPVPNMQIGLHAIAGVKSTAVDYGSTLRAWEDLLGVPHLGHAATATDLRPLAGI